MMVSSSKQSEIKKKNLHDRHLWEAVNGSHFSETLVNPLRLEKWTAQGCLLLANWKVPAVPVF